MRFQALALAFRAADRARVLIRRRFRDLRPDEVTQKTRDDFVTAVDVEVERVLRDILVSGLPGSAYLAEEEHDASGLPAHRWVWVVDPLDGTNNFVFGMPCVAVSIALLEEGVPGVGVVDLPLLGERYWAVRNHGAFDHTGRPLRVRPASGLEGSLLATGFPFRKPHLRERYFRAFHGMFPHVVDFRRAGAAAMDLAYVAAGIFDGFFEMGLSPWDLAAGLLLVEEAGGVVRNWDGGDEVLWRGDVVAGSPGLVEAVLRFTREETRAPGR